MNTIIVIDDSADPGLLAQALPAAHVEVLDRLPDTSHPAVAAVIRSGTRLSAAQLDRLPALRHLVRPGSGTDNIDVAALKARGVTLHRNPTASAAAVAEWSLLAALALTRKAALGHNGLTAGRHLKAACMGEPLSEHRVAIWGAGPVGQAIGRAMRPAVRDLAYAAWPSNPPGLPQRSDAELNAWATMHIVALPLRDTTRAMFGPRWLVQARRCRPMLICAGRIATLDLHFCLDALNAGELTGLAVDAIDAEHVASVAWRTVPLNLLVTPHLGAQRTDVRRALDRWVADTLRVALRVGRGVSHA